MRVGLVGCTKSKLQHRAKAEDLYSSSAMFRGRRAFIGRSCDRWFILSAKHGVLAPSDELEPYDLTLVAAPRPIKRAWAVRVVDELKTALGNVAGMTFEIHAGRDYWGFGVAHDLRRAGARVEIPTEGLTQGQQRRFYLQRVGRVPR
jgi:hypothetical protein